MATLDLLICYYHVMERFGAAVYYKQLYTLLRLI